MIWLRLEVRVATVIISRYRHCRPLSFFFFLLFALVFALAPVFDVFDLRDGLFASAPEWSFEAQT